jgi:hypothetical protein
MESRFSCVQILSRIGAPVKKLRAFDSGRSAAPSLVLPQRVGPLSRDRSGLSSAQRDGATFPTANSDWACGAGRSDRKKRTDTFLIHRQWIAKCRTAATAKMVPLQVWIRSHVVRLNKKAGSVAPLKPPCAPPDGANRK